MLEELAAEIVDSGGLSERQAEVLRLICEGATDKSIARRLAISAKTVAANTDQIYLRMAIRQDAINMRCTAIATAVARGMIRLNIGRVQGAA